MSKKERKKALIERKKTLTDEALAIPEIQQARKYMMVLFIVLIAFRVVNVLFDWIIGSKIGEYQGAIQNTALTALMILFMAAIYQGMKQFAVLGAAGGILSLMNFFTQGTASVIFKSGNFLVISYGTIFIIGAVLQGAVMISILANSKCKHYFKAIVDINVQLKRESSYPI